MESNNQNNSKFPFVRQVLGALVMVALPIIERALESALSRLFETVLSTQGEKKNETGNGNSGAGAGK